MPRQSPTRIVLLTIALAAAAPSVLRPQTGRVPAPPKAHEGQRHAAAAPKPTGEHLSEWMRTHRNLSPEQQQQALQHEPGFSSLPPATQQRMRDQISKLSAMPPDKRDRLLERNEAMEHLTPDQRGQVRSAMEQLASLPPDQRRYVARTFRGLRELKPDQRQNVLNSDRFSTLTEAQRSTLATLMKVEPLLPPPYDATGPVASAAHP